MVRLPATWDIPPLFVESLVFQAQPRTQACGIKVTAFLPGVDVCPWGSVVFLGTSDWFQASHMSLVVLWQRGPHSSVLGKAPPHPRVVPLNLWLGCTPQTFLLPFSGSTGALCVEWALVGSGLWWWFVCSLLESTVRGWEAALPTTNRLTVEFHYRCFIWEVYILPCKELIKRDSYRPFIDVLLKTEFRGFTKRQEPGQQLF